MNKKILMGIGILLIILLLLAVFVILIYKPFITKNVVEQRFSEFEAQSAEKKALGYDVTKAEAFARQARLVYDSGKYNKANKWLNMAFEALEKAEISITPPEAVEEEAAEMLSRVEVATVYQRVTDGKGGRSIDDVVELLKKTETDFIFRAWWRWVPCSEFKETASDEALKFGYTYEHLEEAVTAIKKEMPDVIICGAIPAQRINAEESNPITGETFGKDETWDMALDPAKWDIDMSKEELQETLGEYILLEEEAAYYPDITNPEFQELLLSWAEKQIDCGVDAIWIDSLFSQARIFNAITEDANHPAVKESFESASRIVDEIHNYGYSKGESIPVGTWSGFAELPHSPPDLDFITITPTGEELANKKLDDQNWDETIAKLREKKGDTPIFAVIDWSAGDDAPLSSFSQKLSNEEQREMLKTLDRFFREKGVNFIYPLHGGFMGTSAEKLSFGKYHTYDSAAPEFETEGAIVESITGTE